MTLLQGDDEQIMEARSRICADTDDVGIEELHQRSNHLAGCNAKVLVLLRRLSYHGSGVYRVPAASHLLDMHDRKFRGFRIVTKVIAERTFQTPLMGWNNALQDNLCVCGDHHVNRSRLNHRNGSTAQESRECNFIDALRKRKNRRHHENRICTDDHRNFQTLSLLFRVPIMYAPTLHTLPMHAGRAVAEDLKPVQAAVSRFRDRIVADDDSVSDEASAISRPTLENGKS